MRKPRSVTRANAKLGFQGEKEAGIRINENGYADPTPFFAIREIERKERLIRRNSSDANHRLNNIRRAG